MILHDLGFVKHFSRNLWILYKVDAFTRQSLYRQLKNSAVFTEKYGGCVHRMVTKNQISNPGGEPVGSDAAHFDTGGEWRISGV